MGFPLKTYTRPFLDESLLWFLWGYPTQERHTVYMKVTYFKGSQIRIILPTDKKFTGLGMWRRSPCISAKVPSTCWGWVAWYGPGREVCMLTAPFLLHQPDCMFQMGYGIDFGRVNVILLFIYFSQSHWSWWPADKSNTTNNCITSFSNQRFTSVGGQTTLANICLLFSQDQGSGRRKAQQRFSLVSVFS